jgi:hypothetical protein
MSLRLRVDGYQLEGLDFQLLTLASSCILRHKQYRLDERISARAIYGMIKLHPLNTLFANFESPLAIFTGTIK